MRDGLTRSDRAFLRRTAMTGDHPWAVRLWAYVETQGEREERVRFADMKWRAAEAEIEKLRAEQDNAGFIPWRLAQDSIDELTTEIERLKKEATLFDELLGEAHAAMSRKNDELEGLRNQVEGLERIRQQKLNVEAENERLRAGIREHLDSCRSDDMDDSYAQLQAVLETKP